MSGFDTDRPRRACWVTNSRDPRYPTMPIEQMARECEYGHPAILRHLASFGWNHDRLGFNQSVTPGRVARQLDALRPDLVYTYGGITSLQPIIARRRETGWKGPIVHGWDDYYDEIWAARFGWLAGRFMRALEERVIRASDYVITISRYNQHRAEQWGKRVWYIPNGCDLPVFDRAQCRILLDGALNIVYCGDQAPYKRTEDVVSAMSRVPREIKLYLTGKPYPYLDRYAADNVVFLGFLSKNDVWAVMSQADVLVCTADQDCNAKFHEYLRMGKPILAYDGKPNWLFRNRHNALLTRDYADAIMDLYTSTRLRAELAANAAAELPVHTWREIARQTAAAFNEILELHVDRRAGAQ